MRQILIMTTILLGLASYIQAAEGGNAPAPSDAAWEKARMEKLREYVQDMAPQGFTQTGEIELYTTANLYDKIDGRSELYNSYNVLGLGFVSFALESAPEKFIDIFLYDMREPLGAFGAYSVERWSDADALDLGQGGYRTEKDHFFWLGDYYATILGVDGSEAVQAGCEEIGKKLAARLPKAEGEPWGFAVLPETDREPDSIQYFSIDGLSLDFLLHTFTARYTTGGDEYQIFISRQDSSESAVQVTAQFADYLKAYGSDVREEMHGAAAVIYGDTGGGYHDGVMAVGPYVAGFSALKNVDLVEPIIAALQKSLTKD